VESRKFGVTDPDEEKELQLIQMAQDYGWGSVFYDFRGVPKSATDFIKSQYERFRIPIPPALSNIMPELGGALALELFDYYDPYSLFWCFSDVSYTNDWQKYSYDIWMPDGEIIEADPLQLETFSFVPGQAQGFFEKQIMMPGVDSLPQEVGIFPRDVVDDYVGGHHFPHALHYDHGFPDFSEVEVILAKSCLDSFGRVDQKRMWAYWDISIWAGILWVLGPLSQEFRYKYSELTEVALDHGHAIIYQGNVISPNCYRVSDRQVNSCYKCGLATWCAEMTIDSGGVARIICEGCLTKGMPRLPGTSCGTKFCREWECPHNAHFNDKSAMHGAMRQHGQLAQKSRVHRGLIPAQETRKIIGG